MVKLHFRPYIPNQTVLFPQRIDENIAANDPVRLLIKLLETLKIEIINNSIHDADRVGRSYVFINSLWKKNGLVGNVRTKM